MTRKFPDLTVLIVDDEPLIRWALAETLTDAGCSVVEAGDGSQTLQRLASGPAPDVIFLDFRLPDSNDLGLLATIRQVVPTSVVIMMTAHGTSEIMEAAERLGAYRFLRKPVDLVDVVPMVEQACASRTH
jgi:DNA-binding NtrC family response regulator